MKIIKLSNNPFQDEGHNIEENIERDQFEAKQEFTDQSLGKKGNTHTSQVLNSAMNSIGNKLNSSFVANGAVGWVTHSDGIIYEITVSPAALGQHFNYFQELQNPKKELTQDQDEIDELDELDI